MQLRPSLPARLLVFVAAVLVATGGITGAAAATTANADDRDDATLEDGPLRVAGTLASGVAETTRTLDAVSNETTDAVDATTEETLEGVDEVTNETTTLLGNATGATESTDSLRNVTGETTDGLENVTDGTTDGVDDVTSETADATENASGETGDENATDDGVVLLDPVTTGLEETVSFATTAVERTVGGTTGVVDDAVSETTTVVEETGAATAPGNDVRSTSPLLADSHPAVADDATTVSDPPESDDRASSESADDDENDGGSGADATATDAVLVGLLGAMTASGAAGAGASGAAGAGATGTATWLTQTGVGRSLRRALSVLPLELVPILKYSRYDDSDPLENERRRAVYETVEAEPGCYLSRIADRSGVSLSTVRHHVRVLEDEGMLSAVKVNGKRRYFLGDADAELHAALEESAKREVLEALEALGRAANGDLADALDCDPSTVSHHLSALEADGLVERERDGRSVVNELAPKVRTALREEESALEADARTSAPADD